MTTKFKSMCRGLRKFPDFNHKWVCVCDKSNRISIWRLVMIMLISLTSYRYIIISQFTPCSPWLAKSFRMPKIQMKVTRVSKCMSARRNTLQKLKVRVHCCLEVIWGVYSIPYRTPPYQLMNIIVYIILYVF